MADCKNYYKATIVNMLLVSRCICNLLETMETVTDFILGGSKITADGDCSHEIKMLAPWKKGYDKHRQHIKKAEILLRQQRSF